jgi:hypothetical protein
MPCAYLLGCPGPCGRQDGWRRSRGSETAVRATRPHALHSVFLHPLPTRLIDFLFIHGVTGQHSGAIHRHTHDSSSIIHLTHNITSEFTLLLQSPSAPPATPVPLHRRIPPAGSTSHPVPHPLPTLPLSFLPPLAPPLPLPPPPPTVY